MQAFITYQSDAGTTPVTSSGESRRSRYSRTPSEYAVHIMLDGGHREEVRFQNLDDFRQWYQEIAPKVTSEELLKVPMKTAQGEFMVVRPSKINGIRVEPVFSSSVDRY